MNDEKRYWIWMASLPGIGAKMFYQILKTFGSASDFFDAVDKHSEQLENVPAELLASARAACSKERVAEIICALETKGIQALTRLCQSYPIRLTRIDWPPPVLFIKGTLCNTQRALGIVGTRRCTRRGFELTRRIAAELSMPVISGLARGIDTAAHLGALDAGQPTIAILGCGADVVYPQDNAELYNRILENGAVISELSTGSMPYASNFPVRNRIIAGLSRGLLVVESEATGGTAITTHLAIASGCDVFAAPGPPYITNSALPNLLIANGAVPVCTAADIAAYYNETVQIEQEADKQAAPIDFLQSRILELLKSEDQSAQALADQIGLPANEISIALTMLEISGTVRRVSGGRYGV